MTINSRQKGKRGELDAVHFLRDRGFPARRSQQYAGMNGDADIVGVPGYHIEVKRTEKLKLYDALEQSIGDARDGETPVVMHRRDRKEWVIILRADDFLRLVGNAKPTLDLTDEK